MLSNRITANSLALNPAIHARDSTPNTIRLFHPPLLAKAERMSLLPASAMFLLWQSVSGSHVLRDSQLPSAMQKYFKYSTNENSKYKFQFNNPNSYIPQFNQWRKALCPELKMVFLSRNKPYNTYEICNTRQFDILFT